MCIEHLKCRLFQQCHHGHGAGVTLQGLNLEGVALSDKIASVRPVSLQDIVLDTLWR